MNTDAIVSGCEDVLAQGLALLQELDSVTYAQPLAPPFGASVGQHYRHVVEHFQCFLAGAATIHFDGPFARPLGEAFRGGAQTLNTPHHAAPSVPT